MAKVVIASDPFYIDHDPSLSGACAAMADGQNWHLWSSPVGENLLDGGI